MKNVYLLLIFFVAVLFSSCDVPARFTIGTTLFAPVGPRLAAPGTGYIWIDGDWFWNGRSYSWRDGYWSNPHNGYQWQPGYWRQKPGGYNWKPGRWR